MLGKRSDQRGLFEADHLYLDLVGRDSFYGRLAGLRGQLFRDEDFAALYCRDNGRSSVPPSLLATALWLQAHDRVSDAEAHRRATVDLSWKVALGVEVEVRPTLCGRARCSISGRNWCCMRRCESSFSAQPGTGAGAGSAAGPQPASGPGHDAHLGARGREGHLQSAGGRHPPTAQDPGPGAGSGAGRLGRGAGLCPVPGGQSQGHRGDRLG